MLNSQAPTPERRQTWPRSRRLHHADEFRRVLRQGKRLSRNWFRLVFWAEAPGQARFAVTVRPSVGSACARNRARRQVRESLRIAQAEWPTRGWGVVIIERSAPRELSAGHRHADIERLLGQTRKLAEAEVQ